MDVKTQELVARIADFDFIVTDTEVEALVLESNLIKLHKPRYNFLLKDDKRYPHLKLTINEDFPRVVKTRRVEKDGAVYFGPYLPASLADNTVSLINREFQLRTCSDEVYAIYKRAGRPCMEYQIKRCLRPCQKELCTPEQYREAVNDVKLLLEGKAGELTVQLTARMTAAAEELRFEHAAKSRDLLRTVRALSEQQKMMRFPNPTSISSATTAMLISLRCNSSPCARARSSGGANSTGRMSRSKASIQVSSSAPCSSSTTRRAITFHSRSMSRSTGRIAGCSKRR